MYVVYRIYRERQSYIDQHLHPDICDARRRTQNVNMQACDSSFQTAYKMEVDGVSYTYMAPMYIQSNQKALQYYILDQPFWLDVW